MGRVCFLLVVIAVMYSIAAQRLLLVQYKTEIGTGSEPVMERATHLDGQSVSKSFK